MLRVAVKDSSVRCLGAFELGGCQLGILQSSVGNLRLSAARGHDRFGTRYLPHSEALAGLQRCI
jgi:hypothetical protein